MSDRKNTADKTRPRIMLLTPFFRPNVGGAETHADDLCRYLDKKGYDVTVLTYQPLTTKAKGESREQKGSIFIRRYWWPGHNIFHIVEKYPLLDFIYLTPYLGLRAFLFMLVSRRRTDVIHAQGLNAALIARVLKRLFGVRIVMSTQALYNFVPGSALARTVAWILGGFDSIVVESPESKKELASIGIDNESIDIFEQWIDQAAFAPRDPIECRTQVGCRPDSFVVLYVGRLIEKKGAKALLEASRVFDDSIEFVFVGDDGPLREEIESAAKISDRIKFFANVKNDELTVFYQAADLFVIPSQYEEGTARVMLEALSSGTPVIGSKRGSIPRILSEEVAKVIEPVPDELAKTIRQLYENREELKRLQANCRAYALRNFSDDNAEIITSSYEVVR